MTNVLGTTTRFDFLDYLKGILIFLVVYGHTIQFVEYQSSDLFWYNPVFKIIYMFHMPLFMAISGFVSYNSIQKKPFLDLCFNRVKTLVIPIACFGLLEFVLNLLFGEAIAFKRLPLELLKSILGNLWFLWALFFATLIVSAMHKYNLDKPLFLFLILLIFLLLPNPYDTSLYKFTFLYFILGYLTAKYSTHTHKIFSTKKSDVVMIACLAMSTFFFFFWDKKMYVYTSGMEILDKNVLIVIFRYVVGVIVSIAFMLLSYKIYSWHPTPFIIQLGKNSIYIYILQDVIVFISEGMQFSKMDSVFFTFFVAPMIAFIIVSSCYYAGEFSQRWKIMQVAFGRYNKVSAAK